MKGQWKGKFEGTNSGSVILDMDERQNSFDGVGFLTENDSKLPNYIIEISAPKGEKIFTVNVKVLPVFNGEVLSSPRFAELFPSAQLSSHAETKWNVEERAIKIDWQTEMGTTGTANLVLNDSDKKSERQPEPISNWKQFRDYAVDLEPDRFIFRGQQNCEWRLRTSFHRAGRSNVYRFANSDVPILYKNLCHMTQHVFNLEKSDQNGAFISLERRMVNCDPKILNRHSRESGNHC